MEILTILIYYNYIIRFITIIITLLLLNIYVGSYKKIKMGYTVGLILFAFLILIKNIAALGYIFFTDTPIPITHDGRILEATIELIAMIILYKITRD